MQQYSILRAELLLEHRLQNSRRCSCLRGHQENGCKPHRCPRCHCHFWFDKDYRYRKWERLPNQGRSTWEIKQNYPYHSNLHSWWSQSSHRKWGRECWRLHEKGTTPRVANCPPLLQTLFCSHDMNYGSSRHRQGTASILNFHNTQVHIFKIF